MVRVTASVDEEDKEYIQEQSKEDAEFNSMSEVMRDCITAHKERNELENKIERLHDRLESREERIETLEEELARRRNVEEKVDTLAKRQETSNAPFFVKWYRWFQDQD